MPDGISRRFFIKLAAAAGAAATLPGCEPAARKLIPYVIPDENVIPGVATYYATTCMECPAGCGMVAKVREGRVIKLEGNPADPISQGAICARGQAALQGLYNPDRLPQPMARGAGAQLHAISWDDALKALGTHLKQAAAAGKDRIAFIGGARGPTMRELTARWLSAHNSSRQVTYEPLDDAPAREAVEQLFGRRDLPVYELDKAAFVVSFGADFIETWNSPVELARQYAAFRAPSTRRDGDAIGRSVYVGPRLSLTAAKCDDFVPIAPQHQTQIAMSVLFVVVEQNWIRGDPGITRDRLKAFVAGYEPAAVSGRTGVPAEKIRRIANWFGQADGAVALCGSDDSAAHVAAMVLNTITGNLGRTVRFLDGPQPPAPSSRGEVAALIAAMKGGSVDVLVVGGVNPAFTMAPELGFAQALAKVPFVVWCGEVPDETAQAAQLLLPVHHSLEEWGDSTPRAGVHGLSQPVTSPVFDSRALGDLLLASARSSGTADAALWPDTHTAVQARFARAQTAGDAWTQALREGGVFKPASTANARMQPAALKPQPPSTAPANAAGLALFAFPHIFFYDGRGADKPWLQEIPEPIAQFVWDSWAEVHPDTARQLGVAPDDLIELRSAHGTIQAPVALSKGIKPGVIAVPFGQGHSAYGRYAKDRGDNPWSVLAAGRHSIAVEARKTGVQRSLVTPLGSSDMMGRPLVEAISLEMLQKGIEPPREEKPPQPYEMYDEFAYPKHKWGMTIDLNACTGCSACVAACYAENNVPVVGKTIVGQGRIMSWIRIERYIPEHPDNAPPLYVMPMMCQQCNHAPCEPVCPVFASYHTEEGLNGQVYNRCVGTRYCENNCPYKVRRFDYYEYQFPAPLNLQLNPDVTVRGAGVMEKCTFCIQRIRAAEIDAGHDPLPDGAIVPACAQACPTRAITFGDMNDPNSAMMRRRKDNQIRNYLALEDLNTQPAVTYLRDIYRKKGRT